MKKLTEAEIEQEWNEIKALLVDGCCVQGGHHKAWYLDQIAKRIFGESGYDIMSALESWDKGIAP